MCKRCLSDVLRCVLSGHGCWQIRSVVHSATTRRKGYAGVQAKECITIDYLAIMRSLLIGQKIQDHQLTSTDFDERARLLKSQKKNAQRAAAAAIIKDRLDREKTEETAGKEASDKNVKKEKQAKKTALDRARGRLLSEEEREKTTKD